MARQPIVALHGGAGKVTRARIGDARAEIGLGAIRDGLRVALEILDRDGHLAAATSTGGITGQRPGRVGDSPIPGAGTWADETTCAVSATGDGELFLRVAFAHEVHARVRYQAEALEDACVHALGEVS